jgi:hypothetical protein
MRPKVQWPELVVAKGPLPMVSASALAGINHIWLDVICHVEQYMDTRALADWQMAKWCWRRRQKKRGTDDQLGSRFLELFPVRFVRLH